MAFAAGYGGGSLHARDSFAERIRVIKSANIQAE
jgi:hypothetical protein